MRQVSGNDICDHFTGTVSTCKTRNSLRVNSFYCQMKPDCAEENELFCCITKQFGRRPK